VTCTSPPEHPFAGDYTACDPPQGTEVIVTNIPFSLKLPCLLRAVELGLPFYYAMPMACFENKGVYDLLKVQGKQRRGVSATRHPRLSTQHLAVLWPFVRCIATGGFSGQAGGGTM
jgi:hypothetical protein